MPVAGPCQRPSLAPPHDSYLATPGTASAVPRRAKNCSSGKRKLLPLVARRGLQRDLVALAGRVVDAHRELIGLGIAEPHRQFANIDAFELPAGRHIIAAFGEIASKLQALLVRLMAFRGRDRTARAGELGAVVELPALARVG